MVSTDSFPIVLYTHKNDSIIQFHKCIDICILNEQSTVLGVLEVLKVLRSQCSVGDKEKPIIQQHVRGTKAHLAHTHVPTDHKWRRDRQN